MTSGRGPWTKIALRTLRLIFQNACKAASSISSSSVSRNRSTALNSNWKREMTGEKAGTQDTHRNMQPYTETADRYLATSIEEISLSSPNTCEHR